MSSDASYTRCDMGLFDFFRRSSSRFRSKTTTDSTHTASHAPTAAQSTTTASFQGASASSSSFEDAPISVKVTSTYSQRSSMPEAPHKYLAQQSTSTVSTVSNNDSELGDEDYAERQSESLGNINNFEVVRELGRGATAIVQLGKHKDTEQLVALKVFKTSLLKKMREVKRVGRRMVVSTALDKVQVEIAIMKKFQHGNLLNLLEVFDDDTETLVLMLEYAPYGQIMEWNAAERTYRANPKALSRSDSDVFDEDALRPCVRQLLLGLEYLHQNNICHRDLKPENILLGEDGVYKIADFGVAHLFEDEKKEEQANPSIADVGSAKKKGIVASTAGTYAFMAPETLKGKEYSAYDADVWALGITIHALALGKIPYYHMDPVELFEMIENHPLDLGDDNNNNAPISEGVAQLLRGMLEKDPEKRWSIKQCKEHVWLHEGLDETAKHAFINTKYEQVTVSQEEVAKAVTKVTSMNVLMRVQLGANKWKRKAMMSLETKKRASLSSRPIDEEGGERMSICSPGSERPSFVLTPSMEATEQQATEGNQLEA